MIRVHVGDEIWDIDAQPCRGPMHRLPDAGRLSRLVLLVSPAARPPIQAAWNTLGNQPAWWCYACGAWGVSPQQDRARTARPARGKRAR